MFRSLHRRSILAALALAATLALPAMAEPLKVTDVLGREVAVTMPAKRIMLGFYFEDFLAVGGSEAMDRVVGLSKAAWKDWRPQNWEVHLARRPSLDQLADVGEVEVNTFSVEKVIALKPDLVILGDWQAKGIGGDFERLEKLGIPVVVIDYHTPDLAKHHASTRVMGKLLGTEARADAIVKEVEDTVSLIRDRIARSGRSRPKIYIELGNKGPAEQGVSYGDFMWGAMANDAGGVNITRQVVKTWAPVSPEQVLAAKPDVILIAGSEWRKHATAQLMGEGVTSDEARTRLNGFLKRPGWADLPAVKEGRVHAVYHGASRTIPQHAALQHVAKVLYPDLFADLDPEATYRNFYRKYLPIVPEGTFMLNLTPGKV